MRGNGPSQKRALLVLRWSLAAFFPHMVHHALMAQSWRTVSKQHVVLKTIWFEQKAAVSELFESKQKGALEVVLIVVAWTYLDSLLICCKDLCCDKVRTRSNKFGPKIRKLVIKYLYIRYSIRQQKRMVQNCWHL